MKTGIFFIYLLIAQNFAVPVLIGKYAVFYFSDG